MMTRPRILARAPRLEFWVTRTLWFLVAFACLYLAVRS